MDLLKMYSLLKMGIFHCYVSLPTKGYIWIQSTFWMQKTPWCVVTKMHGWGRTSPKKNFKLSYAWKKHKKILIAKASIWDWVWNCSLLFHLGEIYDIGSIQPSLWKICSSNDWLCQLQKMREWSCDMVMIWIHSPKPLPRARQIPSRKLTWQWKITIFTRRYIFKGSIFHCYVSLAECNGCLIFPHVSELFSTSPPLKLTDCQNFTDQGTCNAIPNKKNMEAGTKNKSKTNARWAPTSINGVK